MTLSIPRFTCDLPLLLGLWALWCFVHSLLVSEPVQRALKRHPFGKRWWRLIFNIFSAVTVAPLGLYTHLADGPYVFRWPPWAIPLKLLLWGLSFYLFGAGLKAYGFLEFLGLKPPREGLLRHGILARLRHPLYTGGILFLWARDQTLCWFWTDLLLTVYLLLGTYLEERKLLRHFGEEYARYRQEVPPFWPRLR